MLGEAVGPPRQSNGHVSPAMYPGLPIDSPKVTESTATAGWPDAVRTLGTPIAAALSLR